MNSTLRLSLAAIAAGIVAATPALAQEATYDYPTVSTSTVTRAQVLAELDQARRDGSMRVWSSSYNHMAAAKSLKSRADVVAELRATGPLDVAMIGEDSGSFQMARQPAAADDAARQLATQKPRTQPATRAANPAAPASATAVSSVQG